MKISEINKLLMGLNIFPDLISNVEITRIIEDIVPNEEAVNNMKSPRGILREQERKNETIEYFEFEKMLYLISVKAYKNKDSPVSFSTLYIQNEKTSSMVHKFIRHIQDPAKLTYRVRLSAGNNSLTYISAPKNSEKPPVQHNKLPIPDKKTRERLLAQNTNDNISTNMNGYESVSVLSKLIYWLKFIKIQ
jgi:hypothetical protein